MVTECRNNCKALKEADGRVKDVGRKTLSLPFHSGALPQADWVFTDLYFYVILYVVKFNIGLLQTPEGKYWLLSPGERPVRACTVANACHRLKRTRRQVYRYIRSGWLTARGKILGEWLLEEDAVTRLVRTPPQAQPLPRRLQALFPEYDVSRLNAGKDQTVVIARILDTGGAEDLRWLLRRYTRGQLARFIRENGARRLGPRSRRLWSIYLGVRPRPAPDWKTPDPWADR